MIYSVNEKRTMQNYRGECLPQQVTHFDNELDQIKWYPCFD